MKLHVSNFKKRWQRRVMVLVLLPFDLVYSQLIALGTTLYCAAHWWAKEDQ